MDGVAVLDIAATWSRWVQALPSDARTKSGLGPVMIRHPKKHEVRPISDEVPGAR